MACTTPGPTPSMRHACPTRGLLETTASTTPTSVRAQRIGHGESLPVGNHETCAGFEPNLAGEVGVPRPWRADPVSPVRDRGLLSARAEEGEQVMSVETDTHQPGFDPDALREKYRTERDKRVRADGNDQYVNVVDQYERFVKDPFVTSEIVREPLFDDVMWSSSAAASAFCSPVPTSAEPLPDIRIIETGSDFGGTWYWNRYPAQCDIESYIYMPLLEEMATCPRRSTPSVTRSSITRSDWPRPSDLYRDVCFRPASPVTVGRRGRPLDHHDRPRRRDARSLPGAPPGC